MWLPSSLPEWIMMSPFCKLSSSLFCPVCLAGAYNGGQCALNGFFNDAYLPKSRGLSARRQTSNLDGQGLLSGIFFPYTTSVSALTLSIHPELKSLFSFPKIYCATGPPDATTTSSSAPRLLIRGIPFCRSYLEAVPLFATWGRTRLGVVPPKHGFVCLQFPMTLNPTGLIT